MLLLPLVGVTEQDHLTQEGVHDHVLVVDLCPPDTREGWRKYRSQNEKKTQTKKQAALCW